MNTPSQEALALANGIESSWPQFSIAAKPARLAIAELIDAKLQLPERNAALLLAQMVCDINTRLPHTFEQQVAINRLREALKAIKTP